MLKNDYRFFKGSDESFRSKVYYLNLAAVKNVKWGTDSKVRVFDSASKLYLEIGARGLFDIHMVNSRKFLQQLAGKNGNLTEKEILEIGDGRRYFRSLIMTQVKSYLAQAIKSGKISILAIDEKLNELSDILQRCLNNYLQDYGLEISEFCIKAVELPEYDPNFRELRNQYAEHSRHMRQEAMQREEKSAAAEREASEAEHAARMRAINAQGEADVIRIYESAKADAYRMRAEAEADEMHMKGYTYCDETVRKVGLEALKAVTAVGNGSDIAGIVNSFTTAGNKEIIHNYSSDLPVTAEYLSWDCICGRKGITSRFCPDCGKKQPEPVWDCICGKKAITSRFCPDCGRRRER